MTGARAHFSKQLKALPRGVWMLGLVSLLMDTSSELIHSLLPVFLVSTLGASMTAVGLVEGIAEATALIAKVFSGTLSDYLGRRKFLTVLGYGLATLAKPLFPLADSIATVLLARFVDRIGKGIRGAPRDALLADIIPPSLRGAGFGLRQSLDAAGAVAGPALAIGAMIYFSDHIREVFWVALLPAALSVTILVIFVQEPERKMNAGAERLHFTDLRELQGAFWGVVVIGAVLTLARFSEAFLVLRASDLGLPLTLVPLVMIVMSIAYSASSYPAGRWSDRIGRRKVLLAGIGCLLISDIVLALASHLVMVFAGIVLWGLHMGFTQGLLAAMVTDVAPQRLRGTALGLFNLVSGVVMLGASLLAGLLWDRFGPIGTFGAGAVLSAIALCGLVLYGTSRPSAPRPPHHSQG
ncbi:MAG: MFS transporter [Alphaproteobacteria bacterium]|nr:MFS transporter [Alphaproteobacteria bacterium]